MSYYGGMPQGVTSLENLPELADIVSPGNGGYATYGHYNGQNNSNGYAQGYNSPGGEIMGPQLEAFQRKHIRTSSGAMPESGMGPYHENNDSPPPHPSIPPAQEDYSDKYSDNLNCAEICNHIQHCPLCSKFYNNDKTIYIIAIVVLAIVCLLLLKRVLNV